MTRVAILCALILSACGGSNGASAQAACEDYLSTAKSCLEEVYSDNQALFDSSWAAIADVCTPYAGSDEQRIVDYYDCIESAYVDADCSSAETYATSLVITDCTL